MLAVDFIVLTSLNYSHYDRGLFLVLCYSFQTNQEEMSLHLPCEYVWVFSSGQIPEA